MRAVALLVLLTGCEKGTIAVVFELHNADVEPTNLYTDQLDAAPENLVAPGGSVQEEWGYDGPIQFIDPRFDFEIFASREGVELASRIFSLETDYVYDCMDGRFVQRVAFDPSADPALDIQQTEATCDAFLR